MKNKIGFHLMAMFISITMVFAGCVNVKEVPEITESDKSAEIGENSGGTTEASSEQEVIELPAPKETVRYFWTGLQGELLPGTRYEGKLYKDSILFSGLTLYNLEDDTEIIVCGVPGCQHTSNDPDCLIGQFSYLDPREAIIYEDKIVFVAYDDKEGYSTLYMVNTDGTGLKNLKEWRGVEMNMYYGFVLVDSKAYCFCRAAETELDETGYVNVIRAEVELYEIDMKSGEIKTVISTGPYYEAQGNYLLYDGGKLLFSYTIQKKSFTDAGISRKEFYENYDEYWKIENELLDKETKRVLIDLGTGETEELDIPIKDNYYVGAFWNQSIIFLTESPDGWKASWYHLETEEMGTLLEGRNVNVYQYDNFLMLEKRNIELDSEYYICTYGDLTLRKLKLPDQPDISGPDWFEIWDESDTMLYVAWIPAKSSSSGEEWIYEYISKQQFYQWLQ